MQRMRPHWKRARNEVLPHMPRAALPQMRVPRARKMRGMRGRRIAAGLPILKSALSVLNFLPLGIQIHKPRILALKAEIACAQRAIALFGDDNLGQSF